MDNNAVLDDAALSLSSELQRVASHMAQAIDAAPMGVQPWTHAFVEDIFPADFYDRLNEGYALSQPMFVERKFTGDPDLVYGAHRQRLEFKAPYDGEERLSLPKVWLDLQDVLGSRTFYVALKRKLEEDLIARYREELDDPEFQDRLEPTLLIAKHPPDYHLGPHTDRAEKVVTCIFNLAESAGLDHLGTALYTPNQADFVSNGRVHHDRAEFTKCAVAPFRPNSALFFARKGAYFHGVERLSAESLGGSERRNIQYNLWDWRPSA